MAIDASIPLGFQMPQFMSPMQAQAQQLNLKQLQQQTQLRQQEIEQGKNSLADQQRIAALYTDRSKNIDPDTGLPTMDALVNSGASPAIIQKMNQQAIEIKSKKDLADMHKSETAQRVEKSRQDAIQRVREDSMSAYQSASALGPQAAKEAGQRVFAEGIADLKKSGLWSADEAAKMQTEFDPQRVSARLLGYKGQLEMDEKKKASEEKIRHDKATEEAAARREGRLISAITGDGKPPAGYRKTSNGDLEFIPGGPADPKTKEGKLGSREQVYLQRTMTSANEAAKDLENVVQLPMTASTGLFGGRKQGSSLMEATKEALTNKMTTQEAQSYNVLSSGFQRSLAGIEASGLAPPGSLSHQMDSVIFKEGDTNLTKLQKLAQTRQIVEAGLESTLANPRVPEDQRKHIEGIISSLKKSVPFSQSDLIRLQSEQEKNPGATLQSTMKKMENGNKSAPADAISHLKANPALKDAFKAKYGYLPEGM